MNKYIKYILILFIILLLIMMIRITRNLIILNSLDKNIAETNYYMKSISYLGENISIMEKYSKGEISLLKIVDNISEHTIYRNKENKKMLINSNGTKTIITSPDNVPNIDINPNYKVLASPNLGTALSVKISSERCNGKNCYLVTNYSDVKVWIEKETGLMVRAMNITSYNNNKEFNVVNDYIYTFNTVTDNDVLEPEI